MVSHVPRYFPKKTMRVKTMSLGMKLIRRNLARFVLSSPQMNESNSTGSTGVKPKMM